MPAGNGAAHSRFSGDGGDSEHFIALEAEPTGSFQDQLGQIERQYREFVEALDLKPGSAIFRRLFVSDVMNQIELLAPSDLANPTADDPVAVSIVQQPPLSGSKLSLLAYHIDSRAPFTKRRLSKHHLLVEKNRLGHLWSTRLCAGDDDGRHSATEQTRRIFDGLIDTLDDQGGTLRDDCVRTWIYMKDVDVFYQDMVDSRRDLFARHGMNGHTHYIASTGIEGTCAHRHDLVAADAYSVLGLERGQVSYLNALDHLCLTRDYGVTFERGTRVAYADRAHHFISGTASIDRAGEVVHRGDVLRQLDRALENVEALLHSGDGRLADLRYLIVYLRDRADTGPVKAYLDRQFPALPVLLVEAAVCRPEWLVEIEGIAVTDNRQPNLPAF